MKNKPIIRSRHSDQQGIVWCFHIISERKSKYRRKTSVLRRFGAGDVTRTRDLLITNHYKKTRLGRRFAPNSPLPKVLFVGMLARISHLFIDELYSFGNRCQHKKNGWAVAHPLSINWLFGYVCGSYRRRNPSLTPKPFARLHGYKSS